MNAKFVTAGSRSPRDDGRIYVAKDSKICETQFEDKKNQAFEVRCTATLAGKPPIDRNWIEFSIMTRGEKRNSYSSFCLDDLEQIRRLRNVCNLALGEDLS